MAVKERYNVCNVRGVSPVSFYVIITRDNIRKEGCFYEQAFTIRTDIHPGTLAIGERTNQLVNLY